MTFLSNLLAYQLTINFLYENELVPYIKLLCYKSNISSQLFLLTDLSTFPSLSMRLN